MENVMSELIYKADKELLAEKGLDFPNKMLKNVNLGKYGKCDLIHFSKHEDNTVFHIDVISAGVPCQSRAYLHRKWISH